MPKKMLVPVALLLTLPLLTNCTDSETGVALGTLERDRVAMTATANEIIIDLPVRRGTFVKKGTILVRFDDKLQRANVAKAKAGVAEAEANLERLRNGARVEEVEAARATVAVARANLVRAELAYKRQKKLIKSRAISQASLDNAVAVRDAARAQLRNAQEQLLELTNGTREEDLHIGEAELKGAQATLVNEQKQLSDLTVIATRDGVLDNLPWNLGERVTVGSPVAVLLAGDAPYARVYVPEPYRVKIREGDRLKVRIDGLAEAVVGTVRWISSDPAFTPYYALNQEERARLMYLAQVQLPKSQSHLPDGVPAQVQMP
ncbi:MAG: HlyD family secretion protein [Hyphomicrobiaceae bacterium]